MLLAGWCVLNYLSANECHKCRVNHSDQNIHLEPSFIVICMCDSQVFLSDNNILRFMSEEKLTVSIFIINYSNRSSEPGSLLSFLF